MVNNGLPPIHPGEYLAETLDELGVSQARFAREIDVSPMRISHVIKGTRPVTAELAGGFRPENGRTRHQGQAGFDPCFRARMIPSDTKPGGQRL